MRCMTKIIVLLMLCCSLVAQGAVTPVYQITEDKGAYLQAILTHDIHRYSAMRDLSDLVVLDNKGNRLPFRVISPNVDVSEKAESIPVRFFPVVVGAAPETLLALSSASIRVDDNAISVSVEKTTKDELVDKTAPVDFFVVDISELKSRADQLTLNWQVSEANRYLEVEVSGTNDLQNWSKITQSTLVQLEKDGQQLTRNAIALHLAEKEYAYLRLKFARGGDDLHIIQATIDNTEKQSLPTPVDLWKIQGVLAKDQDSIVRTSGTVSGASVAAWEFTRDEIAPINHMSLDLGAHTYGDMITIFSRPSTKKSWQLAHQGIWFNAQVGSDWQQSDAIHLHGNSEAHWRIELNEEAGTGLEPKLVLHGQPQVLQFIANNSAPYSIAIDDKAATNNKHTNEHIFSQLISGKEIVWADVNFIKLKPDIHSLSHKMMSVNWKTYVFWGILLSALGVLLGVVIRLVKQMKHQTSQM